MSLGPDGYGTGYPWMPSPPKTSISQLSEGTPFPHRTLTRARLLIKPAKETCLRRRLRAAYKTILTRSAN